MKLRKYLLRVYKLIPNNCQLCQINKKYIYLNQKIGILANWKQLKTTTKLSAWWTCANLTRKVKTKWIWILLNSQLLRTIYAQKGTNKVLKPTWKTNKRLKCRPHVKISLMAGRKQLSPRLRKMLFTFNRLCKQQLTTPPTISPTSSMLSPQERMNASKWKKARWMCKQQLATPPTISPTSSMLSP